MKKRSEVRAEAAATASDRSDVPEERPSSASLQTPANPFDFPNANKAKLAKLRPDLDRVVETVFVKDIFADWKDLQAGLEIGEKRSEHGHAVAALDKAAARADRAHRLYLTARAAREAWEAENEVIFGAMWSEATRALQKEKDDGLRSKQITDADVKNRVATMFPDEYQAQEARRRNIEYTVKSLERLAEIWVGRQRDLSSLVGKLRG